MLLKTKQTRLNRKRIREKCNRRKQNIKNPKKEFIVLVKRLATWQSIKATLQKVLRSSIKNSKISKKKRQYPGYFKLGI